MCRYCMSAACIILFLFVACNQRPPKQDPPYMMTKSHADTLARIGLGYGTFDAYMDQATDMTLSTLRAKIEGTVDRELTHSENDRLRSILHDLITEVYPEDKWIAELSEVFLRRFSPTELADILLFYESSTGRKLLESTPALMQEGEEIASRLIESKEEEFGDRFAEDFARELPSLAEGLQDDSDSVVLNIADTIESCRDIEADEELPISCKFEYVEGSPAMVVTFADMAAAEYYWEDMSKYVAGPFCKAANSSNRHAVVFINLFGPKQARLYSCEASSWSDWHSYEE